MLRRLFACLALLTGLAAAGTPVQAHIVEAEVACVEAALHDAARAPSVIAMAPHLVVQTAYIRAPSHAPIARAKVPFAPSIQLGIDRARE